MLFNKKCKRKGVIFQQKCKRKGVFFQEKCKRKGVFFQENVRERVYFSSSEFYLLSAESQNFGATRRYSLFMITDDGLIEKAGQCTPKLYDSKVSRFVFVKWGFMVKRPGQKK